MINFIMFFNVNNYIMILRKKYLNVKYIVYYLMFWELIQKMNLMIDVLKILFLKYVYIYEFYRLFYVSKYVYFMFKNVYIYFLF